MAKNSELEASLDEFTKKVFGRSRKENCCVICGEEDIKFKDEISRREWHISHMCQTCQDETFGG